MPLTVRQNQRRNPPRPPRQPPIMARTNKLKILKPRKTTTKVMTRVVMTLTRIAKSPKRKTLHWPMIQNRVACVPRRAS